MTDYTTYLVQLVGVGVGGGSRGDRLHYIPCPAGRAGRTAARRRSGGAPRDTSPAGRRRQTPLHPDPLSAGRGDVMSQASYC